MPREQRRLAAIVAADVAGYSRLVTIDEEGTLRALRAHRTDLVEPLLQQHGGRVANTAGDSLLLEFASAVDAVRCAVAIQQGMASRNTDLPEERRIAFRIGVHVGDVVVEGRDLLGDGVNIASRVEGLAEAGGIAITDDSYRQVRDRVEIDWRDGGEHEVKNIARPVKIWCWTDGAPALTQTPPPEAATPPQLEKPSVAVLPFDNMSGDPEQAYFADGLAEDIITSLSHFHSFFVIARNSSFSYKGASTDVRRVAQELDARYVLEGSVRKGGNRVRVTAQLIDGHSGLHIWAERYDREFDDIFELQDELTQNIAATIVPELDKAESKRSATKRPENLNAWDYYLRGMAMIHETTPEGNVTAREMFNSAIAIKPDYSDAYMGLSMSYHRDILLQCTEDRAATANKCLAAARQAVKFDESSSAAYHMLSTAFQWLNNSEAALAEARHAVELNPNDAFGQHALGNKSDLAGDPDGIAHMERAQKLNPQDPQMHTHLTFLARAYVNIGSYETAVERARKAILRRSDYPHAHFILAIALARLGHRDEARTALRTCDEVHPGFVDSRKDWHPYEDPASNQKLLQGLQELADSQEQ